MNEMNIPARYRCGKTSAPAATLRELKAVALYGGGALVVSGLCLAEVWSGRAACQWMLQAALLWILVVCLSRRSLPLNCKPEGNIPYPRLGMANRLTIMRGWLIACTGGFLFQSIPPGALAFVPAFFYAISAIVDRVDGYAARRSGQVSRMGAELDTVFDALGLAVAPLLAFWYGKIHWSYLGVSCAYYMFRLGLSYRRQRDLPVFALKPKLSRRVIAGFQMGFIAVVLFPVFEPPATRVTGMVFMLPVFGGFILDWLSVSGRILHDSREHSDMLQRGETLIHAGLQPFARLVLAGAIWMWLLHLPGNIASGGSHIQPVGYAVAASGLMLVCGILGRISAFWLLLLLGWHYTAHPMGTLDYVLLSTAAWLQVMGTGSFSLYTWDEEWVKRYDGA